MSAPVDPQSYAAAGWHLFPVVAGGKAPLTARGHHDATADPARLAAWSQQHPGCRWGLALAPSGVAVVDIDVKGDGYASLDAHPDLIGTGALTQPTPSGGAHLLYSRPAAMPATRRIGAVPGVDLLAEGYVVLYSGDLDPSALVAAPAGFVAMMSAQRPAVDHTPYTGAGWADLSPEQQPVYHAHGERQVAGLLAELEAAAEWPEGHRDGLGRGWEKITADVAQTLRTLLGEGWSGHDPADTHSRFLASAPDEQLAAEKWRTQRRPASGAGRITPPDALDLLAAGRDRSAPVRPGEPVAQTAEPVEPPHHLDDARLAEWLARHHLGGYRWGGRWYAWTGRVWQHEPDKAVTEAVRLALVDQLETEARAGAEPARLTKLAGLLSNARMKALTDVAAGILRIDPAGFDARPDLLNVANGVVDLRTGELGPHDPALLLTKIARDDYRPDATHPDWPAALEALDEPERAWLQLWAGQAATGHMQADDLVLIAQGSGSNGKSTIFGALTGTLGGHAVSVPEKALTGHTDEHSTSQTVLWGARLGLIEELPEGRQLSTKRLKDLAGTPFITARRMRQDDETHAATHALVVTTNYLPRVSETDPGTWRRLALLRFRKRLTGKSTLFRRRLVDGTGGRGAAVLAWVVAGAVRYHQTQQMPLTATMQADRAEWRGQTDQVLAYVTDRLEFDPASAVLATDLLADFNAWQTQRGQQLWSDQTLTPRFGDHELVAGQGVEHKRTPTARLTLSRSPHAYSQVVPVKPACWLGLRFRTTTGLDGGGRGVPVPLPERGNPGSNGNPPSTPVQGVQEVAR